jgi:hypothetical protein
MRSLFIIVGLFNLLVAVNCHADDHDIYDLRDEYPDCNWNPGPYSLMCKKMSGAWAWKSMIENKYCMLHNESIQLSLRDMLEQEANDYDEHICDTLRDVSWKNYDGKPSRDVTENGITTEECLPWNSEITDTGIISEKSATCDDPAISMDLYKGVNIKKCDMEIAGFWEPRESLRQCIRDHGPVIAILNADTQIFSTTPDNLYSLMSFDIKKLASLIVGYGSRTNTGFLGDDDWFMVHSSIGSNYCEDGYVKVQWNPWIFYPFKYDKFWYIEDAVAL